MCVLPQGLYEEKYTHTTKTFIKMTNRTNPLERYRPEPRTIGLRLMPCPPTWALESLLVTIFLCLPLGLLAIYNSAKVENRYLTGRYEEAAAASAKARTFMTWGARVGAVAWIIGACLYLTGAYHPSFLTFAL